VFLADTLIRFILIMYGKVVAKNVLEIQLFNQHANIPLHVSNQSAETSFYKK